MTEGKPIVAIIGSARSEVVSDPSREQPARNACEELGRELAKAGFRITVYSSDHDFIEGDVVRGFVNEGCAGEGSIICHFPKGDKPKFPEKTGNENLFREIVDPHGDWEVSFYRSLTKVHAVLVVGGASSTLIAGQIAISMGLPIVAIAEFGGAAEKLWRHLSSTPPPVIDEDVQAMAQWTDGAAAKCVGSILRQHNRVLEGRNKIEEERNRLADKAAKWDQYEKDRKKGRRKVLRAGGALVGFIAFLLAGLLIDKSASFFTVVFILGLCFAAGLGATVRMVMPGAPSTRDWAGTIVGVAVGLMMSLLYLLPHMAGESSFVGPDGLITTATRIQFVSAATVAFIAGLGFDYVFDRFLRSAKDKSDGILQGAP